MLAGYGFEGRNSGSGNEVFGSGVCAKTADQRENSGKVGAGQGQAESSGGSAGSAGTPVSRHAGAAGKGGGWLMRWEF